MIVVCGAALLALRRHPVAALAVITIGLSVWLGRGYAGGPIFVTLWIGLFALGLLAPRRTAWIAATAALGALVLVSVVADSSPGLVEHALLVGWSAVAVLAGDAVRSHAERVAARDDRVRQDEQTREEETRRRLAEERLRIARDLHDTVADTMATINVQAGAAAHVMERRPEQARDVLLVIQQASGEALDELAGAAATPARRSRCRSGQGTDTRIGRPRGAPRLHAARRTRSDAPRRRTPSTTFRLLSASRCIASSRSR